MANFDLWTKKRSYIGLSKIVRFKIHTFTLQRCGRRLQYAHARLHANPRVGNSLFAPCTQPRPPPSKAHLSLPRLLTTRFLSRSRPSLTIALRIFAPCLPSSLPISFLSSFSLSFFAVFFTATLRLTSGFWCLLRSCRSPSPVRVYNSASSPSSPSSPSSASSPSSNVPRSTSPSNDGDAAHLSLASRSSAAASSPLYGQPWSI